MIPRKIKMTKKKSIFNLNETKDSYQVKFALNFWNFEGTNTRFCF